MIKSTPIVKVYRNLNNGKLSVVSKSSGKVIGWCDKIILNEVTLIVNESGRDRVRKEGVKNVHSYIQGYPTYVENFKRKNGDMQLKENKYQELDYVEAYYNPYEVDFWVDNIFKNNLRPDWDWCKINCKGEVLLGQRKYF